MSTLAKSSSRWPRVRGNRGCVVLGYDVPDQPRSDAVLLINGNVVGCVELVEVPNEEPRR